MMNERIQELFQEAIDYADKTHTYTSEEGFNIQVWDKIRFEKFAQLIVRECMEQVWYTREDGINGNVSEVIKERMKEHFGVDN